MGKNINHRVSVKTIVANVIRNLQLRHLHDYTPFYEWALEGELKIGTRDVLVKKECALEIKNHRARLPKDFFQLVSIKVGTGFAEWTNREFTLFHKDDPTLADRRDVNLDSNNQANFDLSTAELNLDTRTIPIRFSIDNHYIHFSINKEGRFGIAYWAMPLDKEGIPMVLNTHMDAIEAYCAWKYKTADYVNGKIPQHVYKELENRWVWLCGQARGNDALPDPQEMEYISDMIWNQFLPVENQNIF